MSNQKKYGTLVYIGRFQPLHNVHAEIIERACHLADELIIIVGSAEQPRTTKNPWTFVERKMMISNVLDELDIADTKCVVSVRSNIDTKYNDNAWIERVQTIVRDSRMASGKIGIIGHKKDDSTSTYLDMFPQWELEDVGMLREMHATNIRALYFENGAESIVGMVPPSVYALLKGMESTDFYHTLAGEHQYILDYKQQWNSAPYPVIFVTTDAVVIQSGHVLVIRRRAEPGKGLWALPGGFVNAYTDVSVESAMLRELREETGIKVPAPVLRGNISATRVFDAIDRSERGRVITHAFKITLPDGPLPRVKGMDDADKARWVPISEIRSDQCFEDHFDIIQWAVR